MFIALSGWFGDAFDLLHVFENVIIQNPLDRFVTNDLPSIGVVQVWLTPNPVGGDVPEEYQKYVAGIVSRTEFEAKVDAGEIVGVYEDSGLVGFSKSDMESTNYDYLLVPGASVNTYNDMILDYDRPSIFVSYDDGFQTERDVADLIIPFEDPERAARLLRLSIRIAEILRNSPDPGLVKEFLLGLVGKSDRTNGYRLISALIDRLNIPDAPREVIQ